MTNTDNLSHPAGAATFEPDGPLNTSVLMLGFNRPKMSGKVFERVRLARPRKLYFAVDGPRPDRPDDIGRCSEVRALVDAVDWDCEIHTLFREKNLGCPTAVSSAITWLLDAEGEGIILEDDCVPSLSFFWFCQEMLDRYRDDTRIMHVGGTNRGIPNEDADYSYFFSRYVQIWGWATWKRAWDLFDLKIETWPEVRPLMHNHTYSEGELELRLRQFDSVYYDGYDVWGYQWNYARIINHGLAVLPSVNLISNIGFDATSTHNSKPCEVSFLPTGELRFPLSHPRFVIFNTAFENKHRP